MPQTLNTWKAGIKWTLNLCVLRNSLSLYIHTFFFFFVNLFSSHMRCESIKNKMRRRNGKKIYNANGWRGKEKKSKNLWAQKSANSKKALALHAGKYKWNERTNEWMNCLGGEKSCWRYGDGSWETWSDNDEKLFWVKL